MAVDANHPTAPQRNRPAQGAPMMFEWRRCPRHPWLQASVLVVGTCTPLCMAGDGSTHAVDPAELEQAA